MKRKSWNPRIRLLLTAAIFVPLIGCGRGFYISESDSRALLNTLNSASNANTLLGDLPNGQNHTQSIQVTFDNSSGTPRISNQGSIAAAIHGLRNLQAFQNQGQLNVDRLAAQLEDQLDQWISDRVVLFSDAAGSQVKITRLDSVSARFGQHQFNAVYDPRKSRISFTATAAVTIVFAINVNVLSGLDAVGASIFGQNPNGDYDLSVSLSELPINGWLDLSNPFSDVAQVQLHIDAPAAPGSMTINVAGTDQSQIINGVKAVFQQQFSSPVDSAYLLRFNNFSISDLKIDSASGLSFVYRPLPYSVQPSMHVVARKSDGNVYYATKQSGWWSEFAAVSLPGPVAGDPVIAASGPGQLELAAVGSNGNLYYAGLRDGTWANIFTAQLPPETRAISPSGTSKKWHPLMRIYAANSRPALIATAAGQVEIIGLDTLGSLWHVRRVNAQWQPPVQLPHQSDSATLPVRDPVALWSSNQIELFYVDSQNRLFEQSFAFDSGAWGNQVQVPTQGVNFAPAVAACGDGRIDLVYVRANGDPFHTILGVNPDGSLSIGSETAVGGNLNAGPALVCSGYQQLELIGRGNDNKFYYNHFVGPASPQGLIAGRQVQPGWQGWVQQNSAFTAFPFYMGSIGPNVAVASTRSGDVELLTSPNGSGDLPLLENSFPSGRFGLSDWKAVEWRGFQYINSGQNFGPPDFVGQPALALSDRQLDLGTVNNGNTQVSAVTDGFTRLTQGNSAVGSLLSVGPGAVHLLAIDSVGGEIRDQSFTNFTQLPTLSLAVAGTPIANFAATSNGGGGIDVVGVGQDENLYHWRYVNGRWLGPVQVPFALTVPVQQPHVPRGGPHSNPAPNPPRPGSNNPQHPPQTKVVAGKVVSPAILIDTGAGQLELLANGGPTDYGEHDLYRWRFANGSWTSPQLISTNFTVSTRRFASSMASSWGDGTVDLVLIDDSTGDMFNTRLFPTVSSTTLLPSIGTPPDPRLGSVATWPLLTVGVSSDRRFIDIGGNTISAPVLIALSPTRLHLLAIGTDGYLYDNYTQTTVLSQNRTPGTVSVTGLGGRGLPQWGWGGFQPLTNTPVSLGAATKIADSESAVAVSVSDGGVLVNRFQGWRWSGFFQVAAPVAGASSSPPTVFVLH